MKVELLDADYVPDSVTVYNNIQLRPGSPNHIDAQLRIETVLDGGQYSLQTGPIAFGESKGLFYSYNKGVTYKLVIEVNEVTTWEGTKWDVLYADELAEGSYTYVLDGNIDKIIVRKFRK